MAARGGVLMGGVAALMLSACAPGPDALPDGGSPFAPSGLIRNPGTTESSLIVGHRLMDAGEYQLALRAYLRAASEQGMSAEVLSALGSANLRLGRLGQAETLLRRAVEIDPTQPQVWNNLGVVLMEKGNVAEAKEMFRRAFALDAGGSDAIKENLRLALARHEDSDYSVGKETEFALVYDEGADVLPEDWP